MDSEPKKVTSAPTGSKAAQAAAAANKKMLITAVVVIAALIAGFLGGIDYQKSKTSSALASANGVQAGTAPGGQMRRGGFARNGTFGAVTAVSASSITAQDQRSGSTKTYSITSTTAITKDGATTSASDIGVGDTVIISAASSTSTDATAIRINPQLGGMAPQGAATTPQATTN